MLLINGTRHPRQNKQKFEFVFEELLGLEYALRKRGHDTEDVDIVELATAIRLEVEKTYKVVKGRHTHYEAMGAVGDLFIATKI